MLAGVTVPLPRGPKRDLVLMTTKQAARLLGLSPNAVRAWSNQGILKAYRIGARGDRRFVRKDVELVVQRLHAMRKRRPAP